jgi:IS5 family transposase
MSDRSFARLPSNLTPKKSCLQSTIRSIKPETLEAVRNMLSMGWHDEGHLCLCRLRIDSTVVASNIASPSDSQILNDGVRVQARHLARSKDMTGKKVRFTHQRKASKSLVFQIFNAKKAEKDLVYPQLLALVRIVLKQVDNAFLQIETDYATNPKTQRWIKDVSTTEHYA